MARYVYEPGTQTYFGAADAEIIEVPDEITDADEIEVYLLQASTEAEELVTVEELLELFDAQNGQLPGEDEED